MKIKVMNSILANKIAAGEVVEKIASVVKELVENSIDAESTEIKVDLKESGVNEIKVTDNGIGMDKEDASLAFERHATSKIINEDDLFNISTLGFRGEALPSIASVSKTVLKTSTGEVGVEITYEGGYLISVSNSIARKGTTVSVQNLFYNTPARLKHMKSLYSELANVSDFMNKIALAHPHIKFTLTNDDNVILKTDGSNNLLKTIKDVFGLDVVKKMILVSSSNNDYEIEGYISEPSINRSNRNSMVTLVNGRVVRNTDLNRHINDAYHGYKPDNRYPIVVLNIKADPSLVDVNIHPTKMDIKFSKLEDLGYTIFKMIKDSLKPKNLIVHAEVPLMINEDLSNNQYEELTFDFGSSINEEEIKYHKEKEKFPKLYPVGLVHGTYIICQNETGMYLIDQHAAKERVNYEIYKNKLGNPLNDSISLLIPITIELTSNEFIILKENINLIKQMNFDISEFGINSFIIKSHPTWLLSGYEDESIRKIIETVINKEKDFSIEKFNEALAINLSCKMSIKANENITIKEMENLINDLEKCDNPFNCPHGRPTIVHFSNYDLEKLFKRTGFN
jgi:DNA mismatch repair protein MutL